MNRTNGSWMKLGEWLLNGGQQVSKSTFIINNQETLDNLIWILKDMGLEKRYAVTIEDKNLRSKAQNALLHMWIDIIVKDTGYTKDEMKIILKDKFLGYEEITNKRTGEIIKSLRHTSDLNTTEFTDFLNEIDALCAGLNINLPKPQDLYYEAMGVN